MGWLADNALGIFGGLLGAKGQRDANKTNIRLAREQMAFQERMSNSAYQRAMADMRKAGLNPILAAKQPASSPGGQTAKVESALGAGISNFNQTASARAQQANLTASTRVASAAAQKQEFINQENFNPKLPEKDRQLNAALASYGLTPALMVLAKKQIDEGHTNDLKKLIQDSLINTGNIQAAQHNLNEIVEGLELMVKKTKDWYKKTTEEGRKTIQEKRTYHGVRY
jgi:hypothetical protein